jgi:hypothetical protein
LVEDVESTSSRRSVYVPLYPLAEWIAFNWWLLAANTRPATILARLHRRDDFFDQVPRTYRERHCLRGAGDGFLWPNVFILAEGRSVRLVWRADEETRDDRLIRYLSSGEALVDSTEVQRTLAGIVESVLGRLAEQGVTGTALEDEWQAIQSVDRDEAVYCFAAARLGLDPYAEAEPYEESILEAHRTLGDSDLLGDFLDSVDPPEMDTVLEWVSRVQDEIVNLRTAKSTARWLTPGLHDELRQLRSDLSGAPPWEVGWQRARAVRCSLGLSPAEPLNLDDIVANVVRESPITGIQALGGTRDANSLVVFTRAQRSAAKKFTLARAFWHIAGSEGRFFITSAHSDRQKEERAFAAELIAPAGGIREMVRDDVVAGLDDEILDEVSAHYDVSPMLVRHQIENQLLGSRHDTPLE